MAAGQQKKRLNATSITSVNLHEQHRGKKKRKMELSDNIWNMKPHISLELDDSQKPVARREQVAIAWRDISPFVKPLPQSHSGLADVFSVPEEIFELENINEVLSYKVWETYLSESERKFLTQFLPKGTDLDEVVLPLLMGDNLNFGNPLNKWSASLCCGNLHPDAVLRRAQDLKADKKAYRSGLKKYHHGIIERLLEWKDRWFSCENPEKEFKEKLLRKNITVPDLPVASDRAKPVIIPTKQQPPEIYISDGDATKYMSYFKISKSPHQLVKNIKHSGDGIQSKSFSCVLGDINGFNLLPYEAFEEEERKRLHEHWLQLVRRDLPTAFEHLRERMLLREQWRKSVEQELTEQNEIEMDEDAEKANMESLSAEEAENEQSQVDLETSALELVENGEQQNPPDIDFQDQKDIYSVVRCSMDHLETACALNSNHEPGNYNFDHGQNQDILKPPVDSSLIHPQCLGHSSPAKNAVESKSSFSSNDHHLQRIPSLNSHQEPSPMVLAQEDNLHITESETSTSAKNIWGELGIQESYYEPTSHSHMYSSARVLSLRQPCPVEEQSSCLVNTEAGVLDDQVARSVSSTSNMDGKTTFFSSFANQESNMLLLPFPKWQELLPSYQHETLNIMKKPCLPFPSANDGFTQSSGFIPGFQEQGLLQRKQTREKELYMHQMANRTVYSNGSGRYVSQGNCLSAEPQDWTSFSSPINGGLPGRNLFPAELQVHNALYAVEPSVTIAHGLGGGGNADGSLLSVLSEYKKIPSSLPCDIINSVQLTPSGEFAGGGVTDIDSIYGFLSHQLNNANTPAAASRAGQMSWMNYPHQNPDMHDSMGKPYLRSWNQ